MDIRNYEGSVGSYGVLIRKPGTARSTIVYGEEGYHDSVVAYFSKLVDSRNLYGCGLRMRKTQPPA